MGNRREGAKARLKRGTAVGLLVCGLGCALPAQAQTVAPPPPPTFAANNALSGFLLPYSPVVFDLAVQVGRSFAVITYGTRAYDPVTQNFVVSDLRIRRGPFDFTAERLRVGATTTQLGNFSVDLSRLDLPPDVRKGLAALGQERLAGDAVFSFRSDAARAAYDFDLGLDLPRVGQLQASGAVDGFHILVPTEEVSQIEDGGMPVSQPPMVAGTLRAFSFTYRDLGLVDAATAIAAEGQGVSPEQMRAGLAAMPLMSVNALLDGLPGGASPALRAQAQEWARAAGDFVQRKGALRVTFQPAEPVPLERFTTGVVDEALIAALNPVVASGPNADAPVLAALGPATSPLDAAKAAIGGLGVLQDREGGASALLRLAGGGDLDAVAAIAAAFGNDPLPELGSAELADLYEFLLVGRATGGSVSDANLAAASAELTPLQARTAELQAGAFFRERTENGRAYGAATAENVVGVAPSVLRTVAFDYYEGRKIARDFTEAYALALLAAAAGDRPAQALRDDLGRAAAEGRLVLSVPDARARAAALWAAYSGAAAAQPEPPAPSPPSEAPADAQPQPPAAEQEQPAPPANGRRPGEGYQPPKQILPRPSAPQAQ